jgi:formylglycine-generating enzyme required for sulfatase activity
MITSRSTLSKYPALSAYINAMCTIPGGTFQMGSTTGNGTEQPAHSVTLSPFRMGATPVTVGVWREFAHELGVVIPSIPVPGPAEMSNPWDPTATEPLRLVYPPGANDPEVAKMWTDYASMFVQEMPEPPPWGWSDNHPIVRISWNRIMGLDCKFGFCDWASDIAGFDVTLPTEAQWEYAARGNSETAYPWGDTFDPVYAWTSGKRFADARQSQAVDRTSNIYQNAFGLMDMGGNVWQWCLDWYGPYPEGNQTDPTGPNVSPNNTKCMRGGSWVTNNSDYVRCNYRACYLPASNDDGIGFRLVAGIR